jgi:hypothetical protein
MGGSKKEVPKPFNVKPPVFSTLFTRSLQPAHPADINALLRLCIHDQIDRIIQHHPHCPSAASLDVDGLLLTLERMGEQQ